MVMMDGWSHFCFQFCSAFTVPLIALTVLPSLLQLKRLQPLQPLWPASQKTHLTEIVLSSFLLTLLRSNTPVCKAMDNIRITMSSIFTVIFSFLPVYCLSPSLLFVMYLLDGSAAVSPLPQNQIQCPPKTESTSQEPLNLSSRERPRSPLQKASGRIPGSTLQSRSLRRYNDGLLPQGPAVLVCCISVCARPPGVCMSHSHPPQTLHNSHRPSSSPPTLHTSSCRTTTHAWLYAILSIVYVQMEHIGQHQFRVLGK